MAKTLQDALRRMLEPERLRSDATASGSMGQIAQALAAANRESKQKYGFETMERSPDSLVRQYIELWRQDPKAAKEFLKHLERMGIDTDAFKGRTSGLTSGFSGGEDEIYTAEGLQPYGAR